MKPVMKGLYKQIWVVDPFQELLSITRRENDNEEHQEGAFVKDAAIELNFSICWHTFHACTRQNSNAR